MKWGLLLLFLWQSLFYILYYHNVVQPYTFPTSILFSKGFFHLFFFIPATNSDTDYTSSFNVNNNINQQNSNKNYPRYEDILFHNTAASSTTTTTSCVLRNVLLHVSKTLTMFTFIHIIHSIFVSFQP